MNVSLWYQKNRANYELVDAADIKTPLTIGKVSNWFTKDFKQKIELPQSIQIDHQFTSNWKDLQENEKTDYFIINLFKNRNTNIFAVQVWLENREQPTVYKHHNLDQLKCYVHHIYSPRVRRNEY